MPAMARATAALCAWIRRLERYPAPPLLPAEPLARARVRALAAIVGCNIRPVNKRRILEALRPCFGRRSGLVDGYLVPQLERARRFQVDLARWLRIAAADAACATLDACRLAAPARQPDAG